MSGGFYKRRRGILEHLEAGTISLIDLAVHDYLCLRSNSVIGNGLSIPAGVCMTSAVAIHAVCPSQISERAIQRSLEHLEQIGWIKRWTVRGKRGNYPVLVCRHSVHDLSGKEYRVNGANTADWRNPKYDHVGELSAVRETTDAKVASDLERRVESRETPKAIAPKTGALFPDIPDWIPRDTWNDYVEMRKKIRKLLTPAGVKLAIRELEKFRAEGQDPKAVLEKAILSSNQGLWPISTPKGGTVNGNSSRRPSGAVHSGRQSTQQQPDFAGEL